MNTKRILLDERVEMKVAVKPHAESIIYCRPFEEDAHNVSAFTVCGQEFVHNYTVGADGEKYIITNVITEDGDIYEDVSFKLVVVENGMLPMSTVSLGLTETPTIKQVEPLNESVIQDTLKEYKMNLLTEFLALSQEQKKYISESIESLKDYIDERIECIIAEKLKN